MGWEGCGHGLSSGTAAAAAAAPHGCGNAWGSPGGSAPVGGGTDILGAPPPPKTCSPNLPQPLPSQSTSGPLPRPPSPHPTPSVHPKYTSNPPSKDNPVFLHPTTPQDLHKVPNPPQSHNAPKLPLCLPAPPHPTMFPPTTTRKPPPPQPTVPPPHLQHLGGHMRWWCPLRGGPHGDGRRWAGGLGGCRGAGGAASTSFSALLLLCLCPHQLLPQQHPR